MSVFNSLFTQSAEDKRKPSVVRGCPLRSNARDIEREIEADDQSTGADRLPKYPLDEIGLRKYA